MAEYMISYLKSQQLDQVFIFNRANLHLIFSNFKIIIIKVYKVVDGDTIDVDIDLGFNVSYFQRVRLAGIDTPESRTTQL